LNWGAVGSILSILKDNGSFQLLAESTHQFAACGSAIQVIKLDSKKLRLEGHGKSATTIEISKRIKSFAVSSDILAIWTGSVLEVYKLDGINI
jgi:hypothetical protein